MIKTAFITGATSGFGRATALVFATNGYNVILNGRRQDRLRELAAYIEEKHGVKTLISAFDVRDKKAVNDSINALPEEWKAIDVLVNNAGLALGLTDIQDGDTELWDTMIDTNVKGLLYMTRAIAPLMIIRKQGHIINIGSIAGKEVYPKGNVYCATKHAVDALNKAMRIDLLPHNIKVTAVNPGLAETEFSIVRFSGDEERAKKVYEGFTSLAPEDVAEVIWFAASRSAHVNLNDIIITPTAQANSRDVVREAV